MPRPIHHATNAPAAADLAAGPAPVLRAHDLTKSFRGRPVLDGLTLAVAPGQRLGLIGENGAGKTTLLTLLAGVTEPDAGEVSCPPDVGLLHQQPPWPDHLALRDVLADALAESRHLVRALTARAEEMSADPRDPGPARAYAALLERAEAVDVWSADARAEQVLAGLGLAAVDRDRPLCSLSGGQRGRLALAALLIRRPRALLLDEPTNHLDDDAVSFLEEYLTALPGSVVLASHDRAFLDAVCTGLLDLDPAREGPVYYGGGFTHYLDAKTRERQRWEQQYRAEQDELRALREAVRVTARRVAPGRERGNTDKMSYDHHGGRVQQQISRRVRNAQRRLDALEHTQVRKPPAPLTFGGTLTGGTAGGPVAVQVRGVEVPGRLWLDRLDLAADGRLLVTGPNGAGKSTLLAALAGRLEPAAGTVHWRRGTRVALLEQEVTFARPRRSPRQLYAEAVAAQASAPSLAELGLLRRREHDRPVGELSVGQRRRLALALLIATRPHALLLDEPTNHLSLALAEELEQALHTAAGAVVVASHDRWLRRRWPGTRLPLADGRPAGEVG